MRSHLRDFTMKNTTRLSPPDGSSSASSSNSAPKKRHKNRKKRILIGCLITVGVLVIGAAIAAYAIKEHMLNQIQYVTDPESPTMINESGETVKIADLTTETHEEAGASDKIHNILLLGVDSRDDSYSDDGTGSRADIIMILTVDENNNILKLTSIQRDCYVKIPGYSKLQKVNAAMNFGGPELLITVLESYLRIDLEEYAYVNFAHMANIIDDVGGVWVNVSNSEKSFMPGQTETGDVLLDGEMAVTYARLRHLGNGDYDRSLRQVEVLQSLLNSFMKMNLIQQTNTLSDILSEVVTNIPKGQIEKYAFDILPRLTSSQIDYLQIPIDGYYNEGMYSDVRDNEWSIRCNWNGMIPLIQEFIFGKTFAFDPVDTIAGAPTTTPTPTAAETTKAAA